MLRFMGSQRVRHDSATKLNLLFTKWYGYVKVYVFSVQVIICSYNYNKSKICL